MSTPTKSLALVVPSRLAFVEEVCEKVSGFLGSLGFSEDDVYAFDLSVREGVINAMKHGNQWNELLLVSVVVDVTGDDCVVEVRDSGNHRASIPEASCELLAPNGRGLLIMRSLMDLVEFNQRSHGMELVLRKRVISPERAEIGR